MWIEKDDCLYQKWVFNDFLSAFDFMKKVAMIAEEMNHHPKWSNSYNVVEMWLCTHEEDNQITPKDHLLANAIDKIINY
jgi:4a-hydroxytetrahydrobiopterin dehydratase